MIVPVCMLDVHKVLSVQKAPHAFPFLTLKSCPEDRMKEPRHLKSLTNFRGFPSSLIGVLKPVFSASTLVFELLMLRLTFLADDASPDS